MKGIGKVWHRSHLKNKTELRFDKRMNDYLNRKKY